MSWTGYILLGFLVASVLFLGAAAALHWAHKNGQLENLEEGSRSIFDADEPEGELTDAFPEKRKKKRSDQPT